MRRFMLIPILLFLSTLWVASAAAPLAAPYANFTVWLPIILLGAAVAISITLLYYIVGVILNNPRIKAAALVEVQQALGTILLIVIILGIFSLVGSGISLSYQNLLSPAPGPNQASAASQITNICQHILINSQEGFLNSRATSLFYPQPYPFLNQPTTQVCSIIQGGNGLDPITRNIDYGLAASYVITANLTNESVQELNALYNIDSMIFFLRSINSYGEVCIPVVCAIPVIPREGEEVLSYAIYHGYVFHRTVMPTIITQANLSIYLFVAQMMLMLLLLTAWPYLLAAGLLLRIFAVTRRAGGLLIAGVIIGVLIFPTVFLFQYAALNSLAPPNVPVAQQPGQAVALGTNQVPGVALCGVNLNTPTITLATRFQLFCYTSSSQMPIDYIYKTLEPSKTASAAAILICSADGQPFNNKDLCACNVGNPGFFPQNPSGTSGTVPPCYVKKTLSFYTFPNAASVARLYTCYPPDLTNPGNGPSGLLAFEGDVINSIDSQAPLKIILILSTIISQTTGATTPTGISPISFTPGLPCGISPSNMIMALTSLVNLYGIISVIAFILPIINMLLMLSATFHLSGLMGGETSIIGLSRFL